MATEAPSMERLESLAVDMFSSASSPSARASARIALAPLTASPGAFSHCQTILKGSSSPEAVFLAATALHDLLSSRFAAFTPSQIISLRQSIVELLTTTQRPPFVRSACIRLLCRLTKLAWLDDANHRRICETIIGPMLSGHHTLLGLEILTELLTDIFSTTPSISLANNRRIATSFRVAPLHDAACMALELIGRNDPSIRLAAIRFVTRALTSTATVPLSEESLDESGSLMVSDSWLNTIAREAIVDAITELVVDSDEGSIAAIDLLATLARIRRSLWPTAERRSVWLRCMMRATSKIAQRNLESPEARAVFARFLLHLKMTFQLSDLLAVPDAKTWLSNMGDLTAFAWENWHHPQATLSLLRFWMGVAKACRPSSDEEVHRQIKRLALAFLTSHDDDEDEALDEQVQAYAVLFRVDVDMMMPAFQAQFEGALSTSSWRRLAWLSTLAAYLIAQQRLPVDMHSPTVRGQVDAEISFCILRLLEEPAMQAIGRLQLAVVAFLNELRQTYIIDTSRVLSSNQQTIHDSFYERFSRLCGRPMTVELLATSLVPSLGRLISVFGRPGSSHIEEHTAEAAIDMIVELTTGPMGRAILCQTNLGSMIMSLSQSMVPLAMRQKLSACLGHFLISSVPTDLGADAVVDFFVQQCESLFAPRLSNLLGNQAGAFSDNELVGLISDLTGIASAFTHHSQFDAFWTFIEPHLPLLSAVVSQRQSVVIMAAMLQLIRSMTTHNIVQPFDTASSSGLVLVRSAAPILGLFADSCLLEAGGGTTPITLHTPATPKEAGSPVGSPRTPLPFFFDNNDERIDCLETFYDIMSGITSGSWVQIGAMALYGDMTARTLLRRTMNVALRGVVPLSDTVAIDTIRRAFVDLMLILTEFYMDELFSDLDPDARHQLTQTMANLAVHGNDRGAIDCLAQILSWCPARQKPMGIAFVSEATAGQLLDALLDLALFESDPTRFARSLLPLIVLQVADLEAYRARLCRMNPRSEAIVFQAFDELVANVHRTMAFSRANVAILSANIVRARSVLSKSDMYLSFSPV